MAIDHVRVYSGIPAGGSDPGIFFTRWITHFCAPGFAFFAGVAIYLHGKKLGDKTKLTNFLLKRGLLLVLLEVTLIRFFWTFNFDYSKFFLAGVIWMLGWCIVLMTLFIRLKPVIAGIIGIAIIGLQDLFKQVPHLLPESSQASFGKFWEFIYPSGLQPPNGVTVLYVIVPWIGVMIAGYAFGLLLEMNESKRRKFCYIIGLSATALFIVIGSIIVLNSTKENKMPFVMELLNQRKYPASQLYILMTLGPLIALIPLVEKAKGWIANVLSIFGKVPMFYYLLHILIIHLSALLANMIIGGAAHNEWYATAPYTWLEEGNRWGLGLLYLVFALDVVLLYFLCKWYVNYKTNQPKWWMTYL